MRRRRHKKRRREEQEASVKEASAKEASAQFILPDPLLKELTQNALGESGNPDALAMLMLSISELMKAGEMWEAEHVTFRVTACAFALGPAYLDALLNYRAQVSARLRLLVADCSRER